MRISSKMPNSLHPGITPEYRERQAEREQRRELLAAQNIRASYEGSEVQWNGYASKLQVSCK
jgi:hypothetical protein